MRKVLLILSLTIAGLIFAPFKNFALNEGGEEIKLYLNEPKIISISNPTRVVIGNPNIIDVTNVNKTECTINPKAVGKTSLVIWDTFGEEDYQVKVLAEDLTDIKLRIDSLLSSLGLPEISSRSAEEEGKVILTGRIKTHQDTERIMTALGQLKDKVTDLTVVREDETVIEIDVQVLELDRDATNTLGFSWPANITVTELGSPAIATAGTGIGSLFRVVNLSRDAFTVKLDALVQEGKAKILSRPRLACQSGKEAELLVGGEKPIFTTSVAATTGSSGTNVEYKEFGIKLKIKPTVAEENRIKVALKVEVSEVGDAEIIGSATAPTAKAYPLSKRSANTELFLNDGQSLSIGGLVKQKTEEEVRKTAFLGDVPILGALFRQKITRVGGGQGQRGNNELFILLTPRIVSQRNDTAPARNETGFKITPPEITQNNYSTPADKYAKIIQNRILEKLTYPASAKEAGFQGKLKLKMLISYKGELLDVSVKEPSGYAILDDNAVAIAKNIGVYPPFPSGINKDELWIDVPIVYRLD